MPEPDENIKLQKITKLLEKGGTMLATSHDCGAPMFRYQGKIICPVCDVKEPQEKEAQKTRPEPEAIKRPQVKKEAIPETISTPGSDYNRIAVLTQNKITDLAESLETETDLQRIKDKLECIELGIKIFKLLGS